MKALVVEHIMCEIKADFWADLIADITQCWPDTEHRDQVIKIFLIEIIDCRLHHLSRSAAPQEDSKVGIGRCCQTANLIKYQK